jgi:hypothetical protein
MPQGALLWDVSRLFILPVEKAASGLHNPLVEASRAAPWMEQGDERRRKSLSRKTVNPVGR